MIPKIIFRPKNFYFRNYSACVKLPNLPEFSIEY